MNDETTIILGNEQFVEGHSRFSVLRKCMIKYLSCPATRIRVCNLCYSRVVMQLGLCVFASYWEVLGLSLRGKDLMPLYGSLNMA